MTLLRLRVICETLLAIWSLVVLYLRLFILLPAYQLMSRRIMSSHIKPNQVNSIKCVKMLGPPGDMTAQ